MQHTETYVTACRLRGYQHPDLTSHADQLHGWYDGEDGMDLRLLDRDCDELSTLVNAVEEALRVQRSQLSELEMAWRGPGCDAAAQFLREHCEAAAALAGRLRATVDSCRMLRDDLWRLVDGKVTAAAEIDDRTCAVRSEWLAAAHAATAGNGDTELAGRVIDDQVTPYVDNDIRVDWLTAMRSARASVAAAYETAAAAVEPGSGFVFPVPDDLGPYYRIDDPTPPVWTTALPAGTSAPAGPLADSPVDRSAVAPVPDSAIPHDDPVEPSLNDPPGTPFTDLTDWPAAAGLPGGGMPGGFGLPGETGGLSGLSGLGGVIPRIADAIGGSLGTPDGGTDEPWLDEPPDAHEVDDEEPLGSDKSDDPGEPEETELAAEDLEAPQPETPVSDAAEDSPATGDTAGEAAAGDAAAADQAPPAAGPPAGGEKTPCEIAADELPQVGPP